MHRILASAIVLAIISMPSAFGVSSSGATAFPSLARTLLPVEQPLLVLDEPVLGPPVSLVPVFLHDVNSKENRLFILTRDGALVGDDMHALEQFFSCKRSRRHHSISPSVLAILADIADEYPGHTIEIVSGYRRKGFGVKKSKHFTGNAIDLRVRGVKTREVRDFVWASQPGALGLGHYRHENFIHVDYRPEQPKIGWSQRRRNGSYRYRPGWASVASH